MLRRIASLSLTLILVVGVLSTVFTIHPVKAGTITVPEDYSTIQEAINHANEEDMIFVRNGTYYEHVVVDKTVSLIGESKEATIIDGNKTYPPYIALVNITANNVTINGFSLMNGYYGLCLAHSNNSIVYDNSIRNNYHGILVDHSYSNNISQNSVIEHDGTALQVFYSGYNLIRYNSISNCVIGIHIHYGTNHTIEGNYVSTNRDYGSVIFGITIQGCSENNLLIDNSVSNFRLGIQVQTSGKNLLRNNIMINNLYNLEVSGDSLPCYLQDIDSSNTVNGKPVHYLVNMNSQQIPSDAGYVGVVNSSVITVKNLNLTGCGTVLLAYTDHSMCDNNVSPKILMVSCTRCKLENNSISRTIGLTMSNNNTVIGNIVESGMDCGIQLSSSHGNIISENILQQNSVGIILRESNANTLCENKLQSNSDGVSLSRSSNNTIEKNTIESSARYGIVLWDSSNNNLLFHNNLVSNTVQVRVHDSFNNIWDNGCEGNYWSDYNGTDADSDGIGDTPYVIDANDRDHYPLMNPYWIPADVNHDLIVNIFDVVKITGAYGATPASPNWNPHADIAEPFERVDIFDVVLCTSHYGKKYP
jgi:parallel beta-helix repeat protein